MANRAFARDIKYFTHASSPRGFSHQSFNHLYLSAYPYSTISFTYIFVVLLYHSIVEQSSFPGHPPQSQFPPCRRKASIVHPSTDISHSKIARIKAQPISTMSQTVKTLPRSTTVLFSNKTLSHLPMGQLLAIPPQALSYSLPHIKTSNTSLDLGHKGP
jgi:Leucine-rich repeat (LRR) protein